MSIQPDVQRLRATLESTLTPSIAIGVLSEALERWGMVPEDHAEVVELARGPLHNILVERFGPDQAQEILQTVLDTLNLPEAEARNSIANEWAEEVLTVRAPFVHHPVIVLIASNSQELANNLLACLGTDRVFPLTATDELPLRNGVFQRNPLLFIVDASRPPNVSPSVLASVMRGIPDRILSVLWGQEATFGHELMAQLRAHDIGSLALARSNGFEPLLDLILSRFRAAASSKG